MMKGKMDYSQDSAGNEITFLRYGFHFFLYPMQWRYRVPQFALTNSYPTALNFMGVLSPQVSPASRQPPRRALWFCCSRPSPGLAPG